MWVCVSNGLHSDFFNSFFFQIDIFFFYSCVLLFVFVVVERERCRQKSKLSSVSAHFNFKVWMEFSSSPVMHDKYRNCLNHVIVCFVRKRIKHATAWRKKKAETMMLYFLKSNCNPIIIIHIYEQKTSSLMF